MTKRDELTELKVSGETHPNNLGSAISNYLQEEEEIVVTAMGKDAVNQMCKGVIVGKTHLASTANGMDIDIGFKNKHDEREDKEVTVIAFYLKLS